MAGHNLSANSRHTSTYFAHLLQVFAASYPRSGLEFPRRMRILLDTNLRANRIRSTFPVQTLDHLLLARLLRFDRSGIQVCAHTFEL